MSWCLVLGSSGGIGSAVSHVLRRRGVKVLGVDRTVPKRRQTRYQRSIAVDLSSGVSAYDSLGALAKRFGTPQAVISCVGSYSRTGLEQHSDGSFAATMQDNFNAIFWAIKVLVPQLVSKGSGRLVITTSQAGAAGGYDPVYAAAKAACTALIKSVAREYGRQGIRCNGVSPGPVDTKAARAAMGRARIRFYRRSIPIGRVAEAEEVASFLAYLALDAPDALNGAIFDIDGGLIRR